MNKKGFSLVELSIVMLIIGLLIASISSGVKLVKQAEMRRLVADFDKIQTAMKTFELQYKQLPGDFSSATLFFAGTNNGDGDGIINVLADTAGVGSSEIGRVFEHLSLAEIYSGNFVGGNVLATSATPPTNMVPGGIKSGYFIVTGYTPLGGYSFVNRNQIGGGTKNVIRFGKITNNQPNTNTHVGDGLFTVEEVLLLDRKIDDGLARSGRFTGHNEYRSGTPGIEACLVFSSGVTHNPALPQGGASYNIGTNNVCNVSFDLAF